MIQTQTKTYNRISVAPMMDITYEAFRVFFRYLTRCTVLYTEMIHTLAVEHNPSVLRFSEIEHPIIVQLGGNNPENLAACAKICQEYGYDEINLNVGCPSERVQDGAFGAVLMKDPDLVAKIMKQMTTAVSIPVTVKCRLGVDNCDSYEFTSSFIKKVSEEGGVKHFIIHARKAFLKGLNPSENRTIPPLRYEYVYKLKQDFPHLDFSINGGIKTVEQIEDVLHPEKKLIGCMIGREAYNNPWMFSDFDRRFYGVPNQNLSRREILLEYGREIDILTNTREYKPSYQILVKPIMFLFNGDANNKFYRHFLSKVENHKNYRPFSEFINACILNFELYNKEALDRRPNEQFGTIKQELLNDS